MERAQKRRKAIKACDNCRRHKSRCKWNATSDESPNGSCHRCRVLSQTCTIDGHPPASDTHLAPTPGPSSASTSRIPRRNDTPSVAESSEQEKSLLRNQPNYHEYLHALENSESFFKDLGKIAWSTPMAMLTKLMGWHDGRPSTSDTGKDPTSVGILSRQEVQGILLVFEKKYEPWLGIEAPTPMSPFLISSRCLIAAHHLPTHRRTTVIPPLHFLCREHAMSFILSSTPNLASIQALHILSTWEPIESSTSAGQRMEVQNGGALIATAIAHALILRLDVAAEFVRSHSESKDVPEDVKFKAKMWFGLCASEFMHCVGFGRFRLSSFRQILANTLDDVDLSTPASARQVRLNFLAHVITRLEEHQEKSRSLFTYVKFTFTDEGFKALLKSTEDTVLNPILTSLDSWLVRFSHLHLITDVEKPCFHALLIQYHGYRLLLLSYAVLQIFVSPELDTFTRLNRLHETTWGRQLVLSSKIVLTEFIRFGEQPYASSLSHAPDHLFNLVCIATLLLIKMRHLHGMSQPYPLPTLMPLVEKVTEFFKRLALTEDHLPMRCAMLIETLMKAYERIRASPTGGTSLDRPGETETPTNDNRPWEQPGPSSRPPVSKSIPTLSSTSNVANATNTTDGNFMEANLPEPSSNHDLGLDGLINLDQMGGIELFFSQPIWPKDVLSGQVGQSGSGGSAAFDLRDFFGLYDTQPQF